MTVLQFKPKPRWQPPKKKDRFLRSYMRVAQRDHFCDKCGHTIMPGELYCGTVKIWAGRFWVMKEHDECPGPPIDEQEEERWWEGEDEAQTDLENVA